MWEETVEIVPFSGTLKELEDLLTDYFDKLEPQMYGYMLSDPKTIISQLKNGQDVSVRI